VVLTEHRAPRGGPSASPRGRRYWSCSPTPSPHACGLRPRSCRSSAPSAAPRAQGVRARLARWRTSAAIRRRRRHGRCAGERNEMKPVARREGVGPRLPMAAPRPQATRRRAKRWWRGPRPPGRGGTAEAAFRRLVAGRPAGGHRGRPAAAGGRFDRRPHSSRGGRDVRHERRGPQAGRHALHVLRCRPVHGELRLGLLLGRRRLLTVPATPRSGAGAAGPSFPDPAIYRTFIAGSPSNS
jgi:hypothetical protein